MIVSVRIFVRIGDQRRAIGDKQILASCAWQNPFNTEVFGSVPMRACHLVDNLPPSSIRRILAVDRSLGPKFAAHGLDDGAKRLLHVLAWSNS